MGSLWSPSLPRRCERYVQLGPGVDSVMTNHHRCQSFLTFLDGVVRSEDNSIALAKLLVSSLVVRGAQLSVVKRLDSHFVVSIHTTLVSWVCKRVASYESNGNKKARNKTILFFKVLVPLVTAVDTRDSFKVCVVVVSLSATSLPAHSKAHLDQTLAQSKIAVPATAKAWDAYRVYEKRLQASKEKGEFFLFPE